MGASDRSERLQSLMLNQRGFVFDPASGESYQLSATGLACLEALQAGRSDAELLELLAAGWDVDEETARCDLDAFLSDLEDLGWR